MKQLRINQLLDKLEEYRGNEKVFNQYSQKDSICANNLRTYFNILSRGSVRNLFVGEAPGYKGCRLTGIPFTSEYILIKNPDLLPIFGEGKGYNTLNNNNLTNERTSTLFWKEIKNYDISPLLWNVFPFHPHNISQQFSNRTLDKEEMGAGLNYLKDVIDIFIPKKIIAVGKKAASALEFLNIGFIKIVHPSFDIKQQFKIQIEYLNSKD